MLTNPEVKELQEQINNAQNPLFLFDDDPDGLSSFLIMYKIQKKGHGVIVKSLPKVDFKFIKKVKEYQPDKLFILDMPMVDQNFIDKAKTPIFWIDHHPPIKRNKVNYFNPRINNPDAYIPTTRLAYQVSQNQEDLWIAMIGCIGDYHLPDFKEEFIKKYPDLLENKSNIDDVVYNSQVGKLVRLFSFLLKGKTSEVNKCIKILTRIKTPYEILNQKTSQGRYIYKRFDEINQKYTRLRDLALKEAKKDEKLVIFTYPENEWSFTSELAAEILYHHQDKLVIVARERAGEMKCSLRSKKIPITSKIKKALSGIEGYGGGHECACGASINSKDWNQFILNLKKEIKNG